MMIIHSEKYKLEMFKVENYSKISTDNKFKFNKVYLYSSDDNFSTQIGLPIFKNSKLVNSAIIGSNGGRTRIHKNSQIIDKERIVICCSDLLFSLSIPDLDLLWKVMADQATCFEIFKHKDSYIVHVELEISLIDQHGKILWQRSGADIFTTENGIDDFKITDNFIQAIDWDSRIYKFDFNGMLIE